MRQLQSQDELPEVTLSSFYLSTVDKQAKYYGQLKTKYTPLFNYMDAELTKFDTEKFNSDIQHPMQIELQKAYDNTTNIILTDNINSPKLINSRISIEDNSSYRIIDREGKNDTNVYEANYFNTKTSLNNKYSKIPKISYEGVLNQGNLGCGNYHFYFRYSDADHNLTDIIGQSGLVSVFLGDDGDPLSVHGGIRDTDSNKSVHFKLSNLDQSYSFIQVIMERETSDDQQNRVSQYYIIDKLFPFSLESTDIFITGYENTLPYTVEELNLQYTLFNRVKTITQAQSRLFVGNVDTYLNYSQNLRELSLQFLPYFKKYKAKDKIGQVDQDYRVIDIEENNDSHIYKGEYYNSKNIYYNLGYANHELYRFGIVYIYDNGQLSSVYNVRGTKYCQVLDSFDKNKVTNSYSNIAFEENGNRVHTDPTDDGYITATENDRGVVYLNDTSVSSDWPIYSVGFYYDEGIVKYLKEEHVIGFFFVRQKRMPLRLCQAYTIPVDAGSQLPMLHTGSNDYKMEFFLNGNKEVVNDFSERLRKVSYNRQYGAICPDYFVKQPYLNQFFTGAKFTIKESTQQNSLGYLSSRYKGSRNFRIKNYKYVNSGITYDTYIVGIPDSTPSAAANEEIFRAKAGNQSEAWRFRMAGDLQNRWNRGTITNDDLEKSSEYLRGLYSAYLGLSGYQKSDKYIDIYISGYNADDIDSYINIRMEDTSTYFPVGERFSIDEASNNIEQFGGDNFICQFTWRMNRNFSDATAPTNDVIIEKDTWKDHFKPSENTDTSKNKNVSGKSQFELINRGDINAVKLGSWVTIKVESNYNLNLRSIDNSNPTETALYGHGRGFYPITKMTADGGFKIPDTTQLNDGYNEITGYKYYNRLPVGYKQDLLTNRIYYSDVYVKDSLANGYKVFGQTNFVDYNYELGSITKLEEWYGNIIAVLEHGIIYIPIQEKSIASDGSDIYINYKKILPERALVLSSDYGSKWIDSIIKTPYGIFGVDTCAKKIWSIRGTSPQISIISDFKVESFLNENINLGELDNLPLLGIRNVHTHYNAYKQELMFTFYNWNSLYKNYFKLGENGYEFEKLTKEEIENADQIKEWNLAYNLISDDNGTFTSFYTWMPSYVFNIDNQMYSINEDQTKHNVVAYNGHKYFANGRHLKTLDSDKNEVNKLFNDVYPSTLDYIWKHGEISGIPTPCNYYGIQHPFEFEFLVRDNGAISKIFTNMQIISNAVEPESFSFTIVGDEYDWHKDKLNMYYRQEATKELWHNLGSQITFNPNYRTLVPDWRLTISDRYIKDPYGSGYQGVSKSTYFPLYYRRDKLTDDMYHTMFDSYHKSIYDYRYLSGSEIKFDVREHNFQIVTHIKNMNRAKYGILKANSEYDRGIWKVQIPKINIVQKNEPEWNYPPLIIDWIPNDLKTQNIEADKLPAPYICDLSGYITDEEHPKNNIGTLIDKINSQCYGDWPRYLDLSRWTYTKQLPIRDKWVKIRIRYSGEKLAIISAIKTIFNEIEVLQ